MEDEKKKWKVIGKAKRLKEAAEWEGVYVSPDMSEEERKERLQITKELKAKREETSKNGDNRVWTIRKGKVVELTKQ